MPPPPSAQTNPVIVNEPTPTVPRAVSPRGSEIPVRPVSIRPPGPECVLLVEDEPLLRKAFERVLSRTFEVVCVSTASEAVAVMRTRAVQVVVSDIELPGMDGIGLLKEARQISSLVPVILVTGWPTFETAQNAVNHGAFRYLTKPIAPEEMLDAVSRAARLHAFSRLQQKTRESLRAEPNTAHGERASLEARFDHALETIWIAFQPIVSWKERRAIGYEALLRTGETSLARPPDLIATAERFGRLRELGRAVRAKIAAAHSRAPAGSLFFVNLHPSDLEDDELLDPKSALGPIASQCVLEITERASLDGVRNIGARLAGLRKVGFALAIDDLGAGYAGLTSLAHLEPDVVKLDMSLVRGIDKNQMKQHVVRTVTRLSQDLGMRVVLEGVETEAERDAVLSLGGDLLQGYLFGRPIRTFEPPRF